MKFQKELECVITARATRSDDGELSLKVSASAVYDPDTGATTSIGLVPPYEVVKKVEEAMTAVIVACIPQAEVRIHDAIAKSREVAMDMGEMLKPGETSLPKDTSGELE